MFAISISFTTEPQKLEQKLSQKLEQKLERKLERIIKNKYNYSWGVSEVAVIKIPTNSRVRVSYVKIIFNWNLKINQYP